MGAYLKTLEDMKLDAKKQGKKYANGSTTSYNFVLTVSGLAFRPRHVIIYMRDVYSTDYLGEVITIFDNAIPWNYGGSVGTSKGVRALNGAVSASFSGQSYINDNGFVYTNTGKQNPWYVWETYGD